MLQISDEDFSRLIADVMEELPRTHMDAVKNVAIVYADEPTPEQREQLKLRGDQNLLGLYEGVPLSRRGGLTNFPPDKITVFKNPLLMYAASFQELRAQVKHTVWHEIAHYFGLDHPAIHDIERNWKEG
ncbi:MAG TPA: metallopeptidase family protein [Candidatus Saccharimonadales bacterium]